jgi:hypothetical protein
MRRPGVLPGFWLLRLGGNGPDLYGSILIGTFAVEEIGTAHPDAVNHIQEVSLFFQDSGNVIGSLLGNLQVGFRITCRVRVPGDDKHHGWIADFVFDCW